MCACIAALQIDLDGMVESSHEFDHGAMRRAKRGDSRHQPPQHPDDRRLTAGQTRQPVDARDHAGMYLVPHQSVIG